MLIPNILSSLIATFFCDFNTIRTYFICKELYWTRSRLTTCHWKGTLLLKETKVPHLSTPLIHCWKAFQRKSCLSFFLTKTQHRKSSLFWSIQLQLTLKVCYKRFGILELRNFNKTIRGFIMWHYNCFVMSQYHFMTRLSSFFAIMF